MAEFFVDLCRTRGAGMRVSGEEVARELRPLSESERLGRLLERARAEGVLTGEGEEGRMMRLAETFKANRRAVSGYRPGGYDGRVIVVRAGEAEGGAQDGVDDPTLGWGRVADRVETREVSGDHYTMLSGARVIELAGVIRSYLDEAEQAEEADDRAETGGRDEDYSGDEIGGHDKVEVAPESIRPGRSQR
jgi:thioesterase domain-containing protein